MKRFSIAAALVALAIAVPLGIGSSHREAPLSSLDPTGDDTDVYAFTAKDAPGSLTVVANWVPFEDPAGDPLAARRRQGVRRPAGRPVRAAARARVRQREPRGRDDRQRRRRRRRSRRLRRARDRAAGAGGGC